MQSAVFIWETLKKNMTQFFFFNIKIVSKKEQARNYTLKMN